MTSGHRLQCARYALSRWLHEVKYDGQRLPPERDGNRVPAHWTDRYARR